MRQPHKVTARVCVICKRATGAGLPYHNHMEMHVREGRAVKVTGKGGKVAYKVTE
jgi:hypothetical protein